MADGGNPWQNSIAYICSCHSTWADATAPGLTMHVCHFLLAAASQHCIPSLHRVQAILHVLNSLSHHRRHKL